MMFLAGGVYIGASGATHSAPLTTMWAKPETPTRMVSGRYA